MKELPYRPGFFMVELLIGCAIAMICLTIIMHMVSQLCMHTHENLYTMRQYSQLYDGALLASKGIKSEQSGMHISSCGGALPLASPVLHLPKVHCWRLEYGYQQTKQASALRPSLLYITMDEST